MATCYSTRQPVEVVAFRDIVSLRIHILTEDQRQTTNAYTVQSRV